METEGQVQEQQTGQEPGGASPEGQQPGGQPQGAIDPSTGEWIPKQRFDQVNNRFNQYKGLGSFDDVKARLDRLSQYERQIEEYRAKQGQPQGQQTPQQQDAQAKAIREQLLQVYPELGQIGQIGQLNQMIQQIMQNLQGFQGSQTQLYMERASNHLTGLLKAQNINVNPKLQEDVEDFLLSKMDSSQRAAFERGDLRVLQEVFEDNLESGFLGLLKSQSKGTNPPPKPPMRHGPGGTPPKPPQSNQKLTAKEVHSAAWDRFQASLKE